MSVHDKAMQKGDRFVCLSPWHLCKGFCNSHCYSRLRSAPVLTCSVCVNAVRSLSYNPHARSLFASRTDSILTNIHKLLRKHRLHCCGRHRTTFLRKATVHTHVPSTPPKRNVGYVLTQSATSKSGGTAADRISASLGCSAMASLLCKPTAGSELRHAAESSWLLSACAAVLSNPAPAPSWPLAAGSATARCPLKEAAGGGRDSQNSSISSSRVLLHVVSTCHGDRKASRWQPGADTGLVMCASDLRHGCNHHHE